MQKSQTNIVRLNLFVSKLICLKALHTWRNRQIDLKYRKTFYKLYLLTQPLICFSHDGRFLNTLLQYWQNTSSCWQCLTKTCLLRFCLLLFSLLAADINSHSLQLHPFSVFTMNSNAAEKMNIHTLALYKLYEIKTPFNHRYTI